MKLGLKLLQFIEKYKTHDDRRLADMMYSQFKKDVYVKYRGNKDPWIITQDGLVIIIQCISDREFDIPNSKLLEMYA